MKNAPKKNAPGKHVLPKGVPSMSREEADKHIAVLKKTTANRNQTEHALFELLENGQGIDRITLTVLAGRFVDISGISPLPVPKAGHRLAAKDLFTAHTYTVNGKGPYEPGAAPTLEERLQMKAGIPNLWKIVIEAEKGDAVYIPMGVACFPIADLGAQDPDKAIKLCTEAKIFLYNTCLFALFTGDFNPSYLAKFAVTIQNAATAGLGIIDPHVPNGY